MDPQALAFLMELLQRDPAKVAELAAQLGIEVPASLQDGGGSFESQFAGLMTPPAPATPGTFAGVRPPTGPNNALLPGASPPAGRGSIGQGELFGLLQGRLPGRQEIPALKSGYR